VGCFNLSGPDWRQNILLYKATLVLSAMTENSNLELARGMGRERFNRDL